MSISESRPYRVKVIVFSKDRPMQLDALLRSLKYHCMDLDSSNIYVLFHTSEKQFNQQYNQLKNIYKEITFLKQTNFRKNLINFIDGIGLYLSKLFIYSPSFIRWKLIHNLQFAENEYLLLLVDDSVIIRSFRMADMICCMQNIPELIGFSLRLGENTRYCYPLNKPQKLPQFQEFSHSINYYSWAGADYDFGYPLEVSSSLYRMRDIAPLLLALSYRNPNTLEAALAANSYRYIKSHPFLACYQTSVSFSIPLNRVQDDMKNRFGEFVYYSTKELGDKFDNGEYIDIEQLSGFIPNACHQEVKLNFKTNRSTTFKELK